MKIITIAVAICLALAIQSALAAETVAANTSGTEDGMKIATELLLQEDASEVVPAKDENVDHKKKERDEKAPSDAPLMAGSVTSEDISAVAATAAGETVDAVLAADKASDEPQAAPGSLEYEMKTVDMLADAPAEPSFEKAPSESSLAKR
jgi:hypothetical protein